MKHVAYITGSLLIQQLLSTTAFCAEPIKLGAPLSLTGQLASEGTKEEQGLDMCVEAVNAKGGVKVGSELRPLQLVKYDYQSTTARAIQIVQRLVTVDKVDFLISPYGSGDTKASAPIAERYDIPMMALAASTASVYDQKLKNLFGVLFPNDAIIETEVSFYKKNAPSVKKIAILAMNSLFPKSIAAELKKRALSEGYTIVADEIFASGAMDYSNVLTQIKGTNPDWIYVTGYTQELVLIRRQMASLGLSAPAVTMTAGSAYPEYIDNLKALSNNVASSAWWHPSVIYSDNYIFGSSTEYTKAFEKKYKNAPSYIEAAATAGCEVLAESIEAAGSTEPEKVRAKLYANDFTTFYGKIKFGESGQNQVNGGLVVQIQNEKFVVLAPEAVRQGPMRIGVGTP
jgi:branched-chain amino acid transport system substrate-binding protein